MNWNIVIPPLIALISGISGYFLKYFLDKKARFGTETAGIKRDMYEQYITFMMKFVSNTDNQTGELNKKQTDEVLSKMREFHRQAILYSSPRVVNAFADFLQYAYKHPGGDGKGEYTMVLVTNVFKEMRRDIGLSNHGLRGGAIRLIRPIINDYDTAVKPLEFSLITDAKRAAGIVEREDKK